MELHAGDLSALHDGGEAFAVCRRRGRVGRDRRDVAVGEVHLRAVSHTLEDRGADDPFEAVPPDVGTLMIWPS